MHLENAWSAWIWLCKMCRNPHTLTQRCFFVIYLLVLRHQNVRGLLSLLPFSSPPFCSLYEEKVFIFIYQSLTPPRDGKIAVSAILSVCVCVCVCVSGGCGAMLGVIMKRLRCDRRFLWLGIKPHLIYLNKPHCNFSNTHTHTHTHTHTINKKAYRERHKKVNTFTESHTKKLQKAANLCM